MFSPIDIKIMQQVSLGGSSIFHDQLQVFLLQRFQEYQQLQHEASDHVKSQSAVVTNALLTQ